MNAGTRPERLRSNSLSWKKGPAVFFSIADATVCRTDADFQDPLDNDAGSIYRIGGTVYCNFPLAELNGAANINFTELKFSARLNRGQPE